MRKKLAKPLALLLALAMTAGLAGCSTPAPSTADSGESAATQEEAADPQEAAPAEAAAITVTEESTYDKAMPNMPEVPYWFPADLLAWSPEGDTAAAFNVSSIPLAERVDKASLTPANATQCADMNVVAISIMNANTSGNAPHGLNTVDANMFSYWQYIDKLVYWGGSSGEGLIVAPSADVIDVAHKNGVPVLGTVFFPQDGHGGKLEWLDDFLQKDDAGNFPMVDKLIEVAEYFGFDGWFLNQETEGTDETPLTADHAVLMQEFIQAFKAAAGDSLELMWYDSMTQSGAMDWQNALTEENQCFLIDDGQQPVADAMFLNFWWTEDDLAPEELLKASNAKAAELGLDPYDLYAGIDVQANGYDTAIKWDLFAADGQAPYTSLGLYCPSWTYFSASDFFTDYPERENAFWVNAEGDPFTATAATDTAWRGVSTYAVEQTVIHAVPFVTNFNMGHGYSYFIDGELVSDKDWNNRSMQDILPSYRWHIEQEENALEASMDYSEAYYGGTSLKLVGKAYAGQHSTITLYSTALPLSADLHFTATAKAAAESTMDLVVTLDDGSTQVITGDKPVGTEWTTVSYDLSPLDGKTMTRFGFDVATSEDVYGMKFYLGQVSITDGAERAAGAASNLEVVDTSFDDDDCMYSGVMLSWTADAPADFYEIYRVNQDESISLVGVTTATTHYINALERNDDTNKTNFKVVPVNITGERGTESNVATMEWPDNSLPKADFKASATLAAPGQEITFESLCSTNTETVEWEFPGASVESSTDTAPVVTYDAEGTYTVKVTAKNASGEAVAEKTDLITISSKVPEELALLSQGMETSASAFVNDNEAPPFAVDGDVTTKWCATGTPPHELTVDLGSVKAVSEVRISHAEAGGESDGMNTKGYSIQVSEDGVEFTEVARVTKNYTGESVDTFPVVNAQYVKLVVEVPTQGSDTAARIYEFQVYGLDEAL